MSNDYGKQTADLIEDAFRNLKAATKVGGRSAGTNAAEWEAESRRVYAQAQLQTAQTAAILGLATEVRAVGLLLAAASHPAAEASAELARDAFVAAVIMLGLVEAEPERTSADVAADLYGPGADPADKDVEL